MVLGATEYLEPRIMAGLRLVGAVCMVLWLQEAVAGGSSGSDVEPAVPETTGAVPAAVPAAAPEATVEPSVATAPAEAMPAAMPEEPMPAVPVEASTAPAEAMPAMPEEPVEPSAAPAGVPETECEDVLEELLGEPAPRTVPRPAHTVSERQHIQQQLEILAQLSADAARDHVSRAQQARCLRTQQQLDFTTVPHLFGLLHCATQGLMLLAEQTAALARRQEETQRHFEMMMLAQRRQNREAMEKLQLQHARGSQQLLEVIQNQMGLSMGTVTPGNSGVVTPGPAPLTPGARSTLPPPAKRRSRRNRCDACTALLAANVRRQWCETWKPADTVPRGPDGRYLKRETDRPRSRRKKPKKEKKKRVAEPLAHKPIKGPDDDFDSDGAGGGSCDEELFGAPAVPLVPISAEE